jgi:hypothetical protein
MLCVILQVVLNYFFFNFFNVFHENVTFSSLVYITDIYRLKKIGDMAYCQFVQLNKIRGGRESSVGIATGYGLDGPGIESQWGRDFSHMSRLALGPTQPPVQSVPGLSWG